MSDLRQEIMQKAREHASAGLNAGDVMNKLEKRFIIKPNYSGDPSVGVSTQVAFEIATKAVQEIEANNTVNTTAVAVADAPANGHSTQQEIVVAATIEQVEETTAVAGDPVASIESTAAPIEIDEGATDEEILKSAIEHLKKGDKNDAEIKTALLQEFDGLENDIDDFIKQAHASIPNLLTELEKEVEAAQAAEDTSRQIAGDAVDKQLDAEFEANKLWLENYCLKRNFKMPVSPEDIEKAAKHFRELEEKENDLEEETFDDQKEEPFPECPIFPGALTDLARAIFPSLPLEFKQWGLITRWGLMRSGLDTLAFEPHLQSRFYVVFVSPPNRGKTGSINESRTAMKSISQRLSAKIGKANNSAPTSYICAEVENLASADSGPFLVQEFFDVAKKAGDRYANSICLDKSAKILLDPDELSDVFEKARTSNGRVSTLFIELLKLHSGNRTGSGTRQTGNRPVDNAHLAVLAGTTAKKYPMLWTGTGGGADGLVSRFLAIATNAQQAPAVPLQTDFMAAQKAYERLERLAQLPGQTIGFSEDAAAMLVNWWASFDNGKESAARMLETVKQLLIVLAVANAPDGHAGTTLTVGPDLVKYATSFGNYEIAIRERLNPGDSWTHVQAMEQAIIRWSQKNANRRRPKSRNEFRRGIHPQRMPGGLGTFKYAWDNCVNTGVLKLREQIQRGGGRYSL